MPDHDPREDLILAYDRNAEARDGDRISPWKLRERQRFLELLRAEGARTLLEVGPGPGSYGLFFQERGLQVTCVDLSPEMVRLCRAKGLDAHVIDLLEMTLPAASFDAAWVFNCLLHIPRAQMPEALAAVARVVRPGGLVYLGQYGGERFEGTWEADSYVPKRFFSFHTDDDLRSLVAPCFEVASFRHLEPMHGSDQGFQALILQRRIQPQPDLGATGDLT